MKITRLACSMERSPYRDRKIISWTTPKEADKKNCKNISGDIVVIIFNIFEKFLQIKKIRMT